MSIDIAIKNGTLIKYFKSIDDQCKVQEELNLLDKAYYDGKPMISDSTYDSLRDYINIRFPELRKKVGKKEDNSVWPKVTLEIPMGSLLKVNDKTEFEKWYKKYTTGKLVSSHKVDGSSIELTYVSGKLVRAVTRGDGFIGDDITPNVVKMKVPKTVKGSVNMKVRGEIVILKKDFDAYFAPKGEKNPRNSAAGTMRRLDGAGAEHLTIIAFDILDEATYNTKMDKFNALRSMGFEVPSPVVIDSIESALSLVDYNENKRAELGYEIDGLVFEENSIEHYDDQGSVDNRPKAARAYKFAAEKATCTLMDVVWQIGKTGSLTPVGIISPTTMQGVTISRVMLNNLSHIKELGLGLGSQAELIRANDVIPKLTKCITKGSKAIIPPLNCPSCGSTLDCKDEKHVFCPNHEECPAQTLYRITHYLDTLDVKGMGDKIVEKLFDEGILKDIPDLYTIDMEKVKLIDGIPSANVLKSYKELVTKSKKITIPKFIKAISMKGIGSSMTELVMTKYPDLKSMASADTQVLMAIDGIGPSVAADFVFGIKSKAKLIESLLPFVDFAKSGSGKLNGMVFCFTGFRSPELQSKIEGLGGTVSSSVTKATTHLVCVDLNSLSTKAKDARDKGKTIISKDDLIKLLEE